MFAVFTSIGTSLAELWQAWRILLGTAKPDLKKQHCWEPDLGSMEVYGGVSVLSCQLGRQKEFSSPFH